MAYFKTLCKSDIIDNNMCKTFNGAIVEARNNSIVIMLEDARHFIMRRVVERRRFVKHKFKGDFSPRIWEKIEEAKEGETKYKIESNRDNGFEVICRKDKIYSQ